MRESALVAIIIFIAAILLWIRQPSSESIANENQPQPIVHEKVNVISENKMEKVETTVTTPPSMNTYKQEVENNYHETPASLKEFAIKINRKFMGVSTREEADRFFKELEDCARDVKEEIPTSSRGYCADKAMKLAEKFPHLNNAFYDLKNDLPDKVLILMVPLL